MKKFSLKITKLFILTLIGLFSAFIVNEAMHKKLKALSKNSIYFYPKHNQSIIDFKLKQHDKEIYIVGSSRTAGFERGMFKNNKVYNYSLIINSFNDIYNLVNRLDIGKGDTLIIGLDQWNFNKSFQPRNNNDFKINNLSLPFILFDPVKNINNIYLIGEDAIKNFSGFRNDGSYFYGKRLIVPKRELEDFNFEDTFNRIKNGNRRFEYGSDIDLYQIKVLKRILDFCKKKNIQVFAFSPPFSPSVTKKIKSKKYDYSYMDKSIAETKKLFKEFNFIYKDFTFYDLFDDSYYLDGFHCNRNVYYQILKDLGVPTDSNFDNQFEVSEKELNLLKDYFKFELGD
jgi:hypothetical protein